MILMIKVIILGSSAAPGVPSLSRGWGVCDANNPKNIRTRTSTYLEIHGVRILIDTSADIRMQLVNHNIRDIDAILYTHNHADHVNGIDDLREINRINCKSLNFYAGLHTVRSIKKRFGYLIASAKKIKDIIRQPSLIANVVKANHSFYIQNIKITPIKMKDHCPECLGYVFNDGEYVHIADFKSLAESAYKMILQRPKLMVIPLTTIKGEVQHASLAEILEYIKRINPERIVINHMTTECDYDTINDLTPDNVAPAFDNMIIEIKD